MSQPQAAITLSAGPNFTTIVDPDSYRRLGLQHYSLNVLVNKKARKVYVIARSCGRYEYLHRMIAGAVHPQHVDHINGNGLDNRACNLRLCTPGQNRANCGAIRHNRSGLKGVTWHASSRKWLATVSKAGIRYYLGLFAHKQRAAVAVDRAALALWGEFAGLNYPDRGTRAKMPTQGYVLGSRARKTSTELI